MNMLQILKAAYTGPDPDNTLPLIAQSIEDTLKEQGLTIVPLEPTEEMVLAVTDAWGWDVPLAFWKDMIAAYEKERENG